MNDQNPQPEVLEPILEQSLMKQDEILKALEALMLQNHQQNTEPILEQILMKLHDNEPKGVQQMELKGAQITHMKGETGDQGDLGPMGPAGRDGIDGKDGISIIGPKGDQGIAGIQGPAGRDGITDEESIVRYVLSQIPAPKVGPAGKNGKDADENTIIKKVKALVKYEDLTDKPDIPGIVRTMSQSWGSGFLKDVSDVAITSPANLDTLVFNTSKNIWENKPQTGGSGVVNHDATLTGDGSLLNPLSVVSASGTYNLAFPTNVALGGIPIGTDLTGFTWQQFAQMATITYLSPLASLTGGGTYEFGAAPTITLAWTATKRSNSITGITVDGTVETPTGNTQSGTEPGSYTSNTNKTWNMSVTDGTTTPTASTSIIWQLRKFIGANALTTLAEADIEALSVSNALAASLNGTYAFGASATYKYFCCPSTFADPTATTGFKDSATLLPIGMAGAAEGYTSTDSNGWNYLTVSVTNSTATPYTTNYRVYRSKNVLNGAITIIVS